jgi:hypothetical protein
MTAREHIELAIDGPVAEIVLSRPETRNAMTAAMGREIRDAVGELNASASTCSSSAPPTTPRPTAARCARSTRCDPVFTGE